jgi:hypothetical protein
MDHLLVLFDLCECLLCEQMPSLSDHRIGNYLLFLRQLYYPPRQRIHLVVRFKYLKHISEVLTLHYLVLQYLYEPESHREQGLCPFQ